jgi:hypothetical protein
MDHVHFNGLDFSGTFMPATQSALYYADGTGSPGDPADFEIEIVKCDGKDITDAFFGLEEYGLDITRITDCLAEKCSDDRLSSYADYLEYQMTER